MSKAVLEKLQKQFGDEVVLETHSHAGDDTAVIPREKWREVCEWLKTDPEMAFERMADITCVDWLGQAPRFEIVAHLHSLSKKHHLRLKCRAPEDDPRVPSLVPVWNAANWAEREIYDLYGIGFDDHPDLRRLILYPEFVGHPLRKDYPLNGEQPLVEMHDPTTHRPVMPSADSDLVRIGGSKRKQEKEA